MKTSLYKNVSVDFTDNEEENKFAKSIAGKFESSLAISAEIINSQRISDDRLTGQTVPPERTSPFVALFYEDSEFVNGIKERVKRGIKEEMIPEMLKIVGNDNPKTSYMIFKNKDAYIEEYKKYLNIKRKNPDGYIDILEQDISKSTFYPYKGEMRPSFKKEGLLKEMRWACNAILEGKRTTKELYIFYNEELELFFEEYPHGGK